MEFRQLKYFIEVAKRQHFIQTSREVHVAQSALSRQIAQLEKELGAALFEREGRNVRLTRVGKLFLTRAENALAEIEKGRQEIRTFLDPELGEIRIGFPHSLAIQLIPNIIAGFRREHPRTRFSLRQGPAAEMTEWVERGDLDLALVSPPPGKVPTLMSKKLFTEELLAIVPPEHPLATKKSIALKELENEAFILLRSGYSLRSISWNACRKAGFTPFIAFEGEETDTVRGLVAAGLGVSLMPEIALTEPHSDLQPVPVRVSEPQITREFSVIHHKHSELPPAARLFQQYLVDYFKKT